MRQLFNQEIDLELTFMRIKFTIQYDIDCDGNIDLIAVTGKDGNVLGLLHEKVEAEIKEMIISKLKKEDEENYINAMVA